MRLRTFIRRSIITGMLTGGLCVATATMASAEDTAPQDPLTSTVSTVTNTVVGTVDEVTKPVREPLEKTLTSSSPESPNAPAAPETSPEPPATTPVPADATPELDSAPAPPASPPESAATTEAQPSTDSTGSSDPAAQPSPKSQPTSEAKPAPQTKPTAASDSTPPPRPTPATANALATPPSASSGTETSTGATPEAVSTPQTTTPETTAPETTGDTGVEPVGADAAPQILTQRSVSGPVTYPLPADTYTDSQNFGERSSLRSSWHTGTDFPAACGTPVYAAHAGEVVIETDRPWAGTWLVKVVAKDGLTTWYAHMESVAVSPGTQVEPGTGLGTVGSQGNSTGCHLHFEVHPTGGGIYEDAIDPSAWLAEHASTSTAGVDSSGSGESSSSTASPELLERSLASLAGGDTGTGGRPDLRTPRGAVGEGAGR